MNMRQQRITTSQQEVYLIYLMEHTEFAAARIKDGDFLLLCFLLPFTTWTTFFLRFFFIISRLTGEAKYEENWRELTKLLNSTLGPKKSVEEWKTVSQATYLWVILRSSFFPQVFYNWKGQLRTRAKKLKQIQDGKTGVDDKLALQKLTDVEKRALKLWREDFQDKDIASVSLRVDFNAVIFFAM